MSTTFNPLTAGIQHVYKYGLLPSTLSINALKSAATQAARLASADRPVKQVTAPPGGASDTATLSPTAADALTQAVSTQPLLGVSTAVDPSVVKAPPAPVAEPAPVPQDTSGSQINVLA